MQTKADFGSVEGLVGRLQSVQMKSIVADNRRRRDLKKYGLDKPEATVNLSTGSARATLLIGGKAADNTIYARDASKPAVVTVESALLDDLKKSADDYRRKDVFEFRAFNANRIEITRNGQTVVFERVKGTGRERAGQVAARQPDSRRTSTRTRATACSRSCRTSAPPRSSSRRRRPASTSRR